MNLASAEKEKIVEICERNDIEFCVLFGSFARGEADETSDIDLIVRFSKPKGFDWVDAALEIEDVLGRKLEYYAKRFGEFENGNRKDFGEFELKLEGSFI